MGIDTIERTRVITIPEAGGEAEAAALQERDEATRGNLQAHVNMQHLVAGNPTLTAEGYTPTTEHLVEAHVEVPTQLTAPATSMDLYDDIYSQPAADWGAGEYRAAQIVGAKPAPSADSTIELPERVWQGVGVGLAAVEKMGELGINGLMRFMNMPRHAKRIGHKILSRGPLASSARVEQLKREHLIEKFQKTRPFVVHVNSNQADTLI